MKRLLVVTLATVLAGCPAREHPPQPADVALGTVGLIAEGTALGEPGVRERLEAEIERTTGRRVVRLGALVAPGDREARALANRLVRASGASAGSFFTSRRCRDDVVLTAATTGVDAIYRVSADVVRRTRPATADDPPAGWWASGLAALHLAEPAIVTESVDGRAVLTTFRRSVDDVRVPITQTVTRPSPSLGVARLDVAAAVVEAVRALPVPASPEWEPVARWLTASGCASLALVLCESRVPEASRRGVRTTTLAALRRGGGRQAPKPAIADDAPAVSPDAPAADAAPPGDDRWSCRNLCTMHMVEICNQDKALWDAHGRRWEATACGSMREEEFLRTCYRQQWLSGAYHDACLVPCEQDGRDRLLHVLQAEGCLRQRAS